MAVAWRRGTTWVPHVVMFMDGYDRLDGINFELFDAQTGITKSEFAMSMPGAALRSPSFHQTQIVSAVGLTQNWRADGVRLRSSEASVATSSHPTVEYRDSRQRYHPSKAACSEQISLWDVHGR